MRAAKIGKYETLDFFGSEALNAISSNILFAGRGVQKILITSCNAREGKSYIAQHLLWTFAKRGKQTILIDADLRRSNLISEVGFQADDKILGLAHYLTGQCDAEQAVYQTNIPFASIMPIGRILKNPIPILALPEFTQMLDTLATTFDVILIDTPPLGAVIDAAEIARSCDGAVIVAEYDKTRRRDLIRARALIDQTECPILGCVINKLKMDTFDARRYYQYSEYY